MFGAIAGDVIGAPYEWNRVKHKEFPLFSAKTTFTDDTVLTVAIATAILDGRDYGDVMREFGSRHPHRGYGGFFRKWLFDADMGAYNSFGNGSAMRVSPAGFAATTREEALALATASAECTHNHPEGVKGAQATSLAIFLARGGADKDTIRDSIAKDFGYDLARTLEEIRPVYSFNETCQATVPEAIISFLEADDFEDAIRNAISLGGDSDTLACIAGGIADAFYGGVPTDIRVEIEKYLPDEFLEVIGRFEARFPRAVNS
jgi:ADP-ribosylglycohydrolase